MAEWIVKHLEHDGTVIAEVRPQDLKFTMNKGNAGPHTITYNVAKSNPVVDYDFVGPYRTDFELWRDDYLIMGGMHTSHAVKKGRSDDELIEIGGKSWLHYLQLRHYPFDPRTSPEKHWYDFALNSPHKEGIAYEAFQTDVGTILKNLFDVIFGRPNSMDITYPTLGVGLGIPINFSLAIGDTTKLYDIVAQYSNNRPGYDFEVLALDKEFRLYSPHKYDIAVAEDKTHANWVYDDTFLDQGILDIEFTNEGPQGTHILGQGSGLTNKLAVALGTPALNETVYRRIDYTEDYGDIPNIDLLESLVRGDFVFALNPLHEVVATVKADVIGEDFWILHTAGSALWFDIDFESHHLDSAQEIVSMECSVSDEGEEEVVLKLNQIYPDNDPGVYEG